jgi:hypothetical protein
MYECSGAHNHMCMGRCAVTTDPEYPCRTIAMSSTSEMMSAGGCSFHYHHNVVRELPRGAVRKRGQHPITQSVTMVGRDLVRSNIWAQCFQAPILCMNIHCEKIIAESIPRYLMILHTIPGLTMMFETIPRRDRVGVGCFRHLARPVECAFRDGSMSA